MATPRQSARSISFFLKPRIILNAYPELVDVSANLKRTFRNLAQESSGFDDLLEKVSSMVHKVAPQTRCYYVDEVGEEITSSEISNDVLIMVEAQIVQH